MGSKEVRPVPGFMPPYCSFALHKSQHRLSEENSKCAALSGVRIVLKMNDAMRANIRNLQGHNKDNTSAVWSNSGHFRDVVLHSAWTTYLSRVLRRRHVLI